MTNGTITERELAGTHTVADLTICADWAQAGSAIRYQDDEGDWHSSPFQVADARHDPDTGAELVAEWLDEG